ncbi:FKBP-type peptidyl-prolyl cis-trans isomerase [Flavisolibacter nicotianae]|uniref:FKBP-type peptidyl-prolyl cis-trans isomerase n=1 Tax=Flavisolibacter nicotianae TaxID=2364882 RepID=UPI000EB0F5D2|nr:FKBP-type peptidyl-prolyl cis-trans isomerase [Flavisolibacter nicotianae]
MKITTKHLLPVAALALVFTACKQTDFKKTKEGFPYKVFSSGSGDKVMPGNFVSYHITQKIKDSVLQTSYGNPPMFAGVPKDSASSNPLAALLIEARKGDSIQVIQPIDSMIRKNPRLAEDPILSKKKGQDLVTFIKVVEVYKNEEDAHTAFEKQNIESFNQQPAIAEQRKKDEAEIESYLKANNIQAQRTPWGAYIQVLTPGSGPKPKYGEFSMLKYTGKDLQGKVFDTNNKPDGQLMPLQVGAGGTIPGFEDAVRQLSKGEKATIFIPSVIAYGQQGRPPVIQPNQNLVFDIEVVDVTDKRPEPVGAPIQDSTSR